jgi:NAD-dependent deacetylase
MRHRDKHITVLTGAGISSESGIPTFRGPEGYWTIGSTNYHPQEMATNSMFVQMPWEVWKWYLYRAGICVNARPNPGHMAIVAMEQILQDKFSLITQNVDGIHLRAGNSFDRTYQVHGNIFYMRCSKDCHKQIYVIQEELLVNPGVEEFTKEAKKYLCCPNCGVLARPHVLWFDECYNEHYYKFESALNVAHKTNVLIIAGTSGATTLPNNIVDVVCQKGGTIIDINLERTHFSQVALDSVNGKFINHSCTEGLEILLDKIERDQLL